MTAGSLRLSGVVNGGPTTPLTEPGKLANLPPLDELHVRMVSQMLPGASLQVPNVAAYLCSVLQARVDLLRQEEGGGGGESS